MLKALFNRKKFQEDLQKTIAICERELEHRKQGIPGDCTVEQLENVIIPELKEYLQLSLDKRLKERRKSWWLVSSWVLLDSGVQDMRKVSELAEAILTLERKYGFKP